MAITLIGYRGTGKSTVGAELARRIGWDFVDTDIEIERRAGKNIASIFSEDGEPRFRDIESSVLSDQLVRGQIVVSAGGGAILRDENCRIMKQAGPVVWLQASIETIASRLQTDPSTLARRPSLTGTDPMDEIVEVLAVRQPLYEAASSLTVFTDHRSLASIVDEIVENIDLTDGNPE